MLTGIHPAPLLLPLLLLLPLPLSKGTLRACLYLSVRFYFSPELTGKR